MTAATGIKRVGLAVASLLGAGLALLLILSVVIPADTVRDAVKAQIKEVTGLEPLLRGDVSVSLFPTGTVRFSDVSLGDSSGTPALSAQQLVVRLRFFSFLFGRIEIADVTLVRPTIMIAFASDGSSNWAGHIGTLAHALTPNPDQLKTVKTFSEIRITEGTAIIRDEAYRIFETLTNVEFALAWPSISRTFAATGQFAWNGEAFDGTLSLTDFLAALSGERTGLKVRLTGAPLKFAFDGNFSHRPTLRVDGVVAADSPSLRETLRWATDRSAEGAAFQRFALKAQTTVVGRSIALSKVNVELDGNAGEGVLTYVADGRQTLQGTLAVERLDLTPYASAFRFLNTERTWSRMPLELDALGGMDVDLRISAARVTLAGFNLGQTAVAANLRAGNFTLAIGESQAFGGVIKGSLTLAKSASGADLRTQLQFHEVMLDQTLDAFFGVRRIEGRGDINIAMTGSGGSIYELARGLNGTVTLTSQKGAISGFNVEQSLKRLERNPLAVRGSDFRGGRTPYDDLAVNLKVTSGTAHAQDVRIETPAMRVGLAGSSSIADRDFDLKGTASLSNNSTDAFELPFVVMGTWDDPLFWPDIQMLIRRSGAAAPLLESVRNRLNRETAPTLAGEAAPAPAAPAAASPATTSPVPSASVSPR